MRNAVKLREVVLPATGCRNPTKSPAESFVYVDVAAVDNIEKKIAGARTVIGVEAPSRARKLIRNGDILVSTVRPNLNAVALVSAEFDGQVASTGFCVLRATEKVLPEYLFYFTRSKPFIDGLTSLVAGALYPAVSDSQVLDQELPVPPLPEQRRIVDLLSRAEGIVRLRREAEKKAAGLIPALFLDMFGDPATNPKGWAVKRFEAFGVCRLGKMLDKKKQSGEFQRPYLRNVNVQWDRIDTDDLLTMDFRPDERDTFLVRQGDVLICEGGEIGRAAVWRGQQEECFYQKALHKLTPDLSAARPDFIVWLLWHLAKTGALLGSSTHATIAHLTGVQLKGLNVIAPPVALQTEFELHVDSCHSIQSQQAIATTKAQATFAALLAKVFSEGREAA